MNEVHLEDVGMSIDFFFTGTYTPTPLKKATEEERNTLNHGEHIEHLAEKIDRLFEAIDRLYLTETN
ncbi:hypothetical protein I4U23_027233 [Adineta vaga]|nr:hypothetical protein I4U23_027233 [Adineta vaga]